jgi:hypothetical protein
MNADNTLRPSPGDFELLRARFHFRAIDPLYFPPGKAGDVLRGAFGTMLRKMACAPACPDVPSCEIRSSCTYARVFEPQAVNQGPSGLKDWPRPFVFRAAWLEGAVAAGAEFHFDVHLFDLRAGLLPDLVLAFGQLLREGVGPGRGKADLLSVEECGIRVSLDAEAEPVGRCQVRFVTPTELKNAPTPEFGALFARLRDRLSTLRSLYGSGPLEVDFRAMGERAEKVKMTRCEVRTVEVDRRSGRTGQVHGIGGLVGVAEYEGELAEFLPYLRAGRWVGVGRHTVWGNGEIEVQRCPPPA